MPEAAPSKRCKLFLFGFFSLHDPRKMFTGIICMLACLKCFHDLILRSRWIIIHHRVPGRVEGPSDYLFKAYPLCNYLFLPRDNVQCSYLHRGSMPNGWTVLARKQKKRGEIARRTKNLSRKLYDTETVIFIGHLFADFYGFT